MGKSSKYFHSEKSANNFASSTEEDAISKIVEKEWTYEDFYILKRVYITT